MNPLDWDGYTEPNPPPPPSAPSTDETESSAKEETTLVGHWNVRLTDFQKMIMARVFREDKVPSTNTGSHGMPIHNYL